MGTRSQSLLCTWLRSLPLTTWETRAESPTQPEVALKMVAAALPPGVLRSAESRPLKMARPHPQYR